MSSNLTKILNQEEPKTLYNEEGHDDDCSATTLRQQQQTTPTAATVTCHIDLTGGMTESDMSE